MLYWGPPWLFPAVTATVACFGAYELAAMVAPGNKLYGAYQVLISALVYAGFAGFLPQPLLVPGLSALIVFGLLFNLLLPEPVERAALRVGYSITGPLYVGGLFGLVANLFTHDHGGSWVVLAMLCSFLSDTAGYFAGRALGKHKLAPRISPKKTIEGSLGGLLAALASGIVAHFWFLPGLPLLDAIVLSLAAAALGQLGDLCESLIKRSAGVKDSGTLLPGHGGILDRSDALLFSGSAIWLYIEYLS
jgi:phosphatidate cytidylyltransferase